MFNAGVIEAAATLDDSDYRSKLQAMPGMAKQILGKVAGLAAGYLSFKGLAQGASDSVKAFIVQENAVKGVQAALKKQGQEWNLQSQALGDFASQMQNLTVYGDEGTLAAMSLGMNMGISSSKIKQATKAAIGLAAAYNMDLTTAMTLVAKANAGQTGTLSRHGIVLDQTKSKEEQFSDLLKKGADNFQIAEANAKTTGGALAQLNNAWGDLKEVIGQFIVELFGIGDAAGGTIETVQELTQYVSANTDRWVLAIRTVYYSIEAAVKKAWAVIEPAITYLTQCAVAGCKDIVNVGIWAFDNFGAIWEHLPDVFIGIGKDILLFWKNLFNTLLNFAMNLGKAIWQAIKGGGTAGFSEMADQLISDAIAIVADYGSATEQALKKAGVTPFPELKSGNWSSMVDKYSKLGDEFARIDAKRVEKQTRLEEKYANKLRDSKKAQYGKGVAGDETVAKKDTGPEANTKESVAGSFSAAVLNAMIGTGSPEKETAKNTKEMVRQLRMTNEKLESGALAAQTYA